MRYIKTLLIILLLAVPASAQQAKDLRVLSETPTSIVVEFTPSFAHRVVPGSDGKRYTIYDFSGSVSDQGTPGSPLSPYRPVIINMPARRFSLQIIAQDYDDLSGVNPASHPYWKPLKEFGLSPVYSALNPRFMTTERVPGQVAGLANIRQARGTTLGTLKISPVQIIPGKNEVRLYRRIVVQIDFAAASPGGFPISAFFKGPFPSALQSGAVSKGQNVAGDSPLAQGDWYRMDVNETGIYKIDQSFLSKASISLSSIGNINSIRIFGNGGFELPEDLNETRPNGLEEIPRLVVDRNSNGVFDSDDYVLFYGKSVRGWKYSPAEKTFRHYLNHYTETSVYFMTYGGTGRGRTMDPLVSTSIAGAYKPADFPERTFLERELAQLGNPSINSGREWAGESFNQASSALTFMTSLPGLVPTKPMQYRCAFFSSSTSIDSFVVQENGSTLGSIPMYNIDVGSITDVKAYRAPVAEFKRTGSIPSDRSVLRMQFVTRNSAAEGRLDWFEILYPRRFEADNDSLLFTSPDTTAVVEYTISKFSSRDISVFDVTDHKNVKQVTNLAFDPVDASLARFQAAQTAGGVSEFVAVGPKAFRTAANLKRVANSNLHGLSGGADFVILAPAEFLADAERLRSHRQTSDQLRSLVVDLGQVYNEFSSGMLDPVAIRDFLKYTQSAWSVKPQYVLLFGAGSYDYKNIRKLSDRIWVPPYETLESNVQISTLASDDFFVILDPSSRQISIPIGRLPLRSTDDARNVVDKIIAYDTSRSYDTWHNRITFAADDGLTTTGDDQEIHTSQSERLAQDYTPDTFNKEKIFIVQYPTVNTSTGRTKPTANVAIVDAINQGSVILNWTGHGNTQQWAHENVFSVSQDFPLISNKGKLFFLVAATCDFARYDYDKETSAGEQLILMQGRGAVGAVTPDRVVFSQDNAYLNQRFYAHLFQTDNQGKPVRLGDAMWQTKQELYGENDLKHHLLADPTMRLAIPRANVTVDSINGENQFALVIVGALGKVRVRGTLRKSTGTALSSMQGRAILEAYDSKRKVPVPEWGGYTFVTNGSLIYRGEVSVRNGAVQGTFPIPKDVSYGENRSRINIYAWNDSTDAAGFTENLSISGTSTATIDTVGPAIRVFLQDESFRPGDVVSPDAPLIVDLADSSGINTSTAGIGHKLEAILDGSQRSIDLTDYYRGKLDTYQSGQVKYQFTNLAEGRHTLDVKAWDIFNNAASAETYFEVRAASQLSIYNVVNFPNPFARSTTFTFQRSSTDPVDVEIKIYTVAGRLIQTLEVLSVSDRFVQIPWDGRDRDGSEMANGVYLYRVIAKSFDKSSTSEALGKIAILR
ncbi:MAG: type IX secretion system sortase PorU [Ignavibacteriales bacterium]|nr:type IX secretion system sortase PorU [Ignavibacteriales bacterium]